MKKKFIALGIAFVVLFSMSSCVGDIDGKFDGLSIGFNYEHPNSLLTTICAVRSDTTEFDINDVTLDFYFGWQKEPPYIVESSETALLDDIRGIALYIWNPEIGIKYDAEENPYIDKKEIHYLIEIPASEFISENYKVTISKRGGKQFQKSATLSIPIELFSVKNQSGELWLGIASMWHSPDEELIYNSNYRSKDYIKIRFEHTSENTVKLSK